jgi:hypothetical protein
MGRAAIIVLIFVAIGPLIGLATLSGLLSTVAASQLGQVDVLDKSIETGDPAALGLFVMLYGLLFAHFLGAIWAAVAGAIVALRAHLWGPASIFEGVPVGVFTALASSVGWDLNDLNASSLGQIETQAAAGWALVHIVPAMVCIWLTRRWQGHEPAR